MINVVKQQWYNQINYKNKIIKGETKENVKTTILLLINLVIILHMGSLKIT